jgi:hypothetical protein
MRKVDPLASLRWVQEHLRGLVIADDWAVRALDKLGDVEVWLAGALAHNVADVPAALESLLGGRPPLGMLDDLLGAHVPGAVPSMATLGAAARSWMSGRARGRAEAFAGVNEILAMSTRVDVKDHHTLDALVILAEGLEPEPNDGPIVAMIVGRARRAMAAYRPEVPDA